MEKIVRYFQQPKTHRSLYVLLLIATPFLLLQNYLQSFIGTLSDASFSINEIEIPYVLLIASVLVITVLVLFRRSITTFKIFAWFFVLFLFWVGQQSTDYYFNHKFYELQYNWHYFAYGIFAALNYRVLKTKHFPPQKIILNTFFYALGISAFDELVQIPLSNRIFDVGDISKDLWGTMIGMFILFVIIENAQIFRNSKPYRQVSWKNYLAEPKSVFILAFIFAYIFMVIASLLTDSDYLWQAIVIPVFIFGVVFLIIHLSQNKKWRLAFIAIFITLSGIQLIALSKYWKENITYCGDYLLVYKGIPLPYFDALIYPSGRFRAVDKKTHFSTRDQQTIKAFAQNILIIGTGKNLKTGIGFPKDELTQFIYNHSQNKGLQIIIMENEQACLKYNQLAKEGKRPTLILHHD
jgi:VanZ family protein/uncharacterized protein